MTVLSVSAAATCHAQHVLLVVIVGCVCVLPRGSRAKELQPAMLKCCCLLSAAFVLPPGSRAKELTRLIQFKPTADGSSFGAAVLAAAAASS
jgi:hypothetical protein